MRIEENVDGMTSQTEDTETRRADGGAVPQKEASTVLGKFKDVDALARAYEALQAEFTRRSQRLRTLEREAEKSNLQADSSSGAEKLRKTAKTRREEAQAFDAFVSDMRASRGERDPVYLEDPLKENVAVEPKEALASEDGEDGLEPVVEKVPSGTELDEQGGKSRPTSAEKVLKEKERALRGVEGSAPVESGNEGEFLHTVEKEGDTLTSEELYRQALQNEEVRLRIVGEYLTSLGKSGAPVTGKGNGVLATPPVKARTVGQAGNMALLYFRKPMEG